MYIKNQVFLVLGISKSGFSAADYILKNGGKCFLYEQLKSSSIEEKISSLVALGGVVVSDEQIDQVIEEIDVLIISPGIPINHEVAVKSKRKDKRIMGELEFGYLCNLPTIIGVTGTNGKTTTCTMIESILSEWTKKCFLVGNVGVPVTSKASEIDRESYCVTEVSSFQLESAYSFCPHVSCVLNVAPDHLERHYSMENYVFLKKRIFKNQRESEYSVLNYDDSIVKTFYNECRAKVLWVSCKEKVNGAYTLDGNLHYKDDLIMKEADLAMRGAHNVYNALFAIAVCKLLNVPNKIIEKSLKSIKGIKHRIEYIKTINGVNYYNDSKATNVASTLTAISSMQSPTVLILGGSDKGENYDSLFERIRNSQIKHVILTGATRYAMLDSANKKGCLEVTITPDLEFAIKIANMISSKGDNVLLSPACASFDKFNSYEERGEKFTQLVKELRE